MHRFVSCLCIAYLTVCLVADVMHLVYVSQTSMTGGSAREPRQSCSQGSKLSRDYDVDYVFLINYHLFPSKLNLTLFTTLVS